MFNVRGFIVFSVLVITFRCTNVFAQITAAPTSCGAKSNTSCEECLSNVSCLWCITTKKCIDYPVQTVLPPYSVCPLSNARWGKCWVNFQALIIALSVIAGVIIIATLLCCFCCCKCENIGSKRTEERLETQADLRRVQQQERKAQMRSRHDEIRKKYGLTSDNPYSRFENN